MTRRSTSARCWDQSSSSVLTDSPTHRLTVSPSHRLTVIIPKHKRPIPHVPPCPQLPADAWQRPYMPEAEPFVQPNAGRVRQGDPAEEALEPFVAKGREKDLENPCGDALAVQLRTHIDPDLAGTPVSPARLPG